MSIKLVMLSSPSEVKNILLPRYLQFYHTSFIPDFQFLSCIISIPLEESPLAFLLELACWQCVLLVFLIWECLGFAFIPKGYLLDIEFCVNGTLKTLFHFLLTPMVSDEKSAVFQMTSSTWDESCFSVMWFSLSGWIFFIDLSSNSGSLILSSIFCFEPV